MAVRIVECLSWVCCPDDGSACGAGRMLKVWLSELLNVLAGYVARMMGVPVELVAAVNPNDIVYRALHTGDFSLRKRIKLQNNRKIKLDNFIF